MAVVFCIIFFAVGIALLIVGYRGIRIGRSPHCRRCKSQLAEEGGTIPPRCSECGHDLTSPRAICEGSRRTSPLISWLGVLMLSITVFWMGTVVWGKVRSTDWLPHLPNWWLVQVELGSSNQDWNTAVLRELDSRIKNKKLSESHRRKVINQGLDAHVDETAEWNPVWGDVIEQGIIDGLVSDEQAGVYSRGTIELECRTNQEGVVVLWFKTKRAGTEGRLRSGVAWRVDHLLIDGEEIVSDDGREYGGVTFVPLYSWASTGSDLFTLPDGINPDINECVVGVTLGWHRRLLKDVYHIGLDHAANYSFESFGEDLFDSDEIAVWQDRFVVNGKNKPEDE